MEDQFLEDWSTECAVSECDLEISTMRSPKPTTAVEP
jgi:hypothetical protein